MLGIRRSRAIAAVALVFTVTAIGCDEEGLALDAGVDAAPGDASPPRDAGLDCPTGQHLCGGGCIDDLPNEPENGCRLGCGDPCPLPPEGVASCAADGTCVTGCEPPFRLEEGECVCAPTSCESIGYECGAPDDGCGSPLDCGACETGVCVDGRCGCVPDEGEPNDSRLAADANGSLARFTDNPSSMETFEAWNLHSDRDEDWYRFDVSDERDWFCTGDSCNPDITIVLDRIPSGSNYDLGAWYVCSETRDHDSYCRSGAPDNSLGTGCVAETSGNLPETVGIQTRCRGTTDESGHLYVRVTSRTWGGSCEPYRLRISVD